MNKKFIAERITALRLAAGLSEYKLSQNIGKCDNYINKVSSGLITPSLTTIMDICEYFGITLFQFFQEESTAFSLTAAKITALLPYINEDKLQTLLEVAYSMKEKN